MKVLLCHNFYQYPGGEDKVFFDEGRLLESHGHQVVRYTKHNHDIPAMGRLAVARRTIFNPHAYRELRALIERERPDVLHAHNLFPLISPAAYEAARAGGVAVVQTLHNYRWLCPRADFLRDGRICEDCLGKAVPWPAVRHRCYQGSGATSALVAGMLVNHRARRTLVRKVDRFITPSHFARSKFLEAGWTAEKLCVKPNFVTPDMGAGSGDGGYAFYAGRLTREKGVHVLLSAWRRLPKGTKLRIVGDGPLRPQVEEAAAQGRGIEYFGQRTADEVLQMLGEAVCVILPSICYETFGRTIVEAYSRGTPAIASRLSSMAELVEEGRTGLLAEPGSDESLAACVERLLRERERLAAMREAARAEFEAYYTERANLAMLEEIYHEAIEAASVYGGKPITPVLDDETVAATQRPTPANEHVLSQAARESSGR